MLCLYMTVLTGVLCSTAVLTTCLHSYGTVIGIHTQNVFIAKMGGKEIYVSTVHLP